jgi:peptidoglycan hydrolase-like protein with peptidoglycan-binding domain
LDPVQTTAMPDFPRHSRVARLFLFPLLSVIVLLLTSSLALPGQSATPRPAQAAKPAAAKRATPAKKPAAAKKPVAARKTAARKPARRTTARRTAPARVPLQPGPERVKEIQQALSSAGYLEGEPDGKWGEMSMAAMKRFQEDHSISPTGRINSLSLIALGLGPQRGPAPGASSVLEPEAPSQPEPAPDEEPAVVKDADP